jgi:hypothetical protein
MVNKYFDDFATQCNYKVTYIFRKNGVLCNGSATLKSSDPMTSKGHVISSVRYLVEQSHSGSSVTDVQITGWREIK